jgi:hypothetical protein
MILGMATMNNESFEPQLWQGTLLFWAIFLFAVFINTLVSSVLPKFEGLILILHILGFFAILIPLVTLGPHASASDVFGTFVNNGGWSSNGVSFMVGMMGNAFAFVGTDAAFHVCIFPISHCVTILTLYRCPKKPSTPPSSSQLLFSSVSASTAPAVSP